MKVEQTFILGLLVIEPDFFEDSRGYFFESFSREKYSQIGITSEFVQDNVSKSGKNTIRGLHYQTGKFAQGKLCQVLKGKVLDVAVDIRYGSPTFGKYFSVELSEDNHRQIWIPPGMAHGFSVLSEEAIFLYKCTEKYDKASERAIIYSDESLGIDWKVSDPVVSAKDLQAGKFADIEKDFFYT